MSIVFNRLSPGIIGNTPTEMKRIAIHLLFVAVFLAVSCQKAPELALSSPSSIDVSANGGTSTIAFTTNGDWTARSSDSWVTASPSSGTAPENGTATVKVNCAANTTYDARSATVTITVEDLTQTVTVNQPVNQGLIVPNKLFEITGPATITVEVQSNVKYEVSISDNWITQVGQKALVTETLLFEVEDNDTYDARSATITIKAVEGSIADQVILVKQAQKDAILVDDANFEMPYGGGEIQVNVQANVQFDVKPEAEWIHYLETKALSNSTVCLIVDENGTYDMREGTILISQQNGSFSYKLTVKQAGRIAVSSVSLDKTELTLEPDSTAILIATVMPDNATDKSVTWSSSDTEVATVSGSGVVAAVKPGNATVTVKTNDGGKTASCTVIVISSLSPLAIPDAVDLGLSSGLKWASFNMGASSPEEYGYYYAWGEVEPKSEYSWSTCSWYDGSDNSITKYNADIRCGEVDDRTVLEPGDDVASVKLGGSWRMPTITEWTELYTECTWTWIALNGICGRMATGPNGNCIFLPAAGYRDGTSSSYVDTQGWYWSSSLCTTWAYRALRFCFNSYSFAWGEFDRYFGNCVRPVYGPVVPVSIISLDITSLFMMEGETQTLTATILPPNASNQAYSWSSSDTEVAAVSNSGVVTAKKAGSAGITARTYDGGKTAICRVTVTAASSAQEAVDLGLPSGIKWASCNLGASKPEGWGLHFAWGETETKADYSWSTYKWCDGSGSTLTKYNSNSSGGAVDNKTVLEPEDDVAHVKLGGNWRMPTDADWTELRTVCTWTWATLNDMNGMKITGPNGNSIFLPSAGFRDGIKHNNARVDGWYWSSSLYTDNQYMQHLAWCVTNYYPDGSNRIPYFRYLGFSVRPVTD